MRGWSTPAIGWTWRRRSPLGSTSIVCCGSAAIDRARRRRGRTLVERSVERAVKALNLVLQAGGFGVVAIDLADVPLVALKRLPFTTWLRVQRAIEGSDTACVLVVPEPLARSAGGLTVSLAGRTGVDRHGGSQPSSGADGDCGARDVAAAAGGRNRRHAGRWQWTAVMPSGYGIDVARFGYGHSACLAEAAK